jgi:3-hydroxyacyl-CoA dehydrogenase
MHFMNPVPIMKLVEIINGEATASEITETIVALTKKIDKIPCVVKDAPGFIANRILMPMINEAIYAFAEGISDAATIDQIMKLGMAHPMGPLQLADYIGLDVCKNIMTIMEMNLRPEYKDKIWIFDRAIISAYTWAILRKRLGRSQAELEFLKLINSDLYKNSKTLVVSVAGQTGDSSRIKDTWDGKHSTTEEQLLMASLIESGLKNLADTNKNNGLSFVFNQFDEASVNSFNQECCKLLGLEPNK